MVEFYILKMLEFRIKQSLSRYAPGLACGLGPATALTAIQAVIHYLVAASLPPEGFMNSGSSKYALACFGVLELVHEESVRGADCAKM